MYAVVQGKVGNLPSHYISRGFLADIKVMAETTICLVNMLHLLCAPKDAKKEGWTVKHAIS